MKLVINAENCTGCRDCELACSFHKSGYKLFNPKKSCIRVIDLNNLGFSNPVACLQCPKPKCVEACPKGALSQSNNLLTIIIDKSKCDGCGICVDACIIGAIYFDEENRLPLICDLCGGSPACIEWCATHALTLSKKSDSSSKKRLNHTISKAKPYLNEWGCPGNALSYYEKFL